MSQCVDGEAAAHLRVRYDFEGERVQLQANAALIIIQGNIPVRKETTARVYQLWGRYETSSQFTYGNPEIGLQLYKADDLCAVCMHSVTIEKVKRRLLRHPTDRFAMVLDAHAECSCAALRYAPDRIAHGDKVFILGCSDGVALRVPFSPHRILVEYIRKQMQVHVSHPEPQQNLKCHLTGTQRSRLRQYPVHDAGFRQSTTQRPVRRRSSSFPVTTSILCTELTTRTVAIRNLLSLLLHVGHIPCTERWSSNIHEDGSETLNFAIESIEGTEAQGSEIFEDNVPPLFYDAIDGAGCHTAECSIQYDTSDHVGYFDKSTHSLQPPSTFNEPAQSSMDSPKSKAANGEANRELFEHIQALCERAKRETAQLIPNRLDEPASLSTSCDQLRALICQLEVCCSRMRAFGWLLVGAQPSADSGCTDPNLLRLWTELLRYTGTWFVGLQKGFAWSKNLRHLLIESQQQLQHAEAYIESQLHPGAQIQCSDPMDIPFFGDMGKCALDESRLRNDIQQVTEFGDLQTALHLAKVIRRRLSDWFTHLKLLLMTSADSEALSAILARESRDSGLAATGTEVTAPTNSHRLELLRLHSFISGLLSDTERLLIEWKRREDPSRSHRTVARPLECSEGSPGMSHGYPQLQLTGRSGSLHTNMNNSVPQAFADESELMTSSDTEDNIEELVSVTSRSSVSSVSDTSDGPINPELITDASSSTEVTAHSLVPSEVIAFPPNTWSIPSTPSGYLLTDSDSLRVVQPMAHGDMPVLNCYSLGSGRNIFISAVDDDEQCNTMSTLKESSETCELALSPLDANIESRPWDTSLSRHDKHSLGEDSQYELPPGNVARFFNFSQPFVQICAWLLQCTIFFILRAKQRIIDGNIQYSLLQRDTVPHASSRIQLCPDKNRFLAKCLLPLQRVARGVSYGCLWLSRPVFVKVLAATFLLLFMLMFLPLVFDWALSIPIQHAHSSCSYRWFTGSWLHTSSEVGPQRTLSKSWPNAAPPF